MEQTQINLINYLLSRNLAVKNFQLIICSLFINILLIILFSAKTGCKICGKLILTSRLSIHVKTHSVGRSLLCELCGRTFLHRSSLRNHIQCHHKGVARTKNFLCTTCGYSCISKYKLQLHERTHTDERVKKFLLILSQFKRFHFFYEIKQPVECRFCDKRFRDECTLKRHIRYVYTRIRHDVLRILHSIHL